MQKQHLLLVLLAFFSVQYIHTSDHGATPETVEKKPHFAAAYKSLEKPTHDPETTIAGRNFYDLYLNISSLHSSIIVSEDALKKIAGFRTTSLNFLIQNASTGNLPNMFQDISKKCASILSLANDIEQQKATKDATILRQQQTIQQQNTTIQQQNGDLAKLEKENSKFRFKPLFTGIAIGAGAMFLGQKYLTKDTFRSFFTGNQTVKN